jgi:hypothetical protein
MSPEGVVPATVGTSNEDGQWLDLGISAEDVSEWKANGFGAFEAALAQGDGFTPSFARHYRNQLRRIADTWIREGLDSVEGLHWHRAGFAAADAVQLRSQGVDVSTAQIRREGFDWR